MYDGTTIIQLFFLAKHDLSVPPVRFILVPATASRAVVPSLQIAAFTWSYLQPCTEGKRSPSPRLPPGLMFLDQCKQRIGVLSEWVTICGYSRL